MANRSINFVAVGLGWDDDLFRLDLCDFCTGLVNDLALLESAFGKIGLGVIIDN